ncbi:NADP-dependent isocitrate dehydrogenase [Acidimicrobiia bacterium]|jgi:isocitrate dehydrogenase|nr:NADP-dependent isocitrate dehydrogenase [Acidimicrobiaceae bacterium]MDA8653426.1 NADP-dependent isocitrate dehydrogenase [Candidatus Actinomarina sp.]MDA9036990.1 NADP-dependent isocitrate dehydrogenase [Acidimicrobiia bacterium]MDA8710082.1 NADP-dependent isocitrate dehydrogenase [Candidatus Actinomarina sp.]MDA9197611.1 NADP-dependent isocitrate dehydrogenase [Acidimicrobiia bacterium]|tara:strand:+ start:6608 stop:7837 length:1230 start_codon:yes stop_codon:yes gene_type:complete
MVENLNRSELNIAINKTRESFDTDNPTVPFIEGDGIGIDIWPASQSVFDAVVEKAYNGERKINWIEVLAGQKAYDTVSEWLPKKTLDTFDEHGVGIKGPLTTPVGEGIRSINVAIRQELDLYVCLRPIKYFKGIETPTKSPQDVDIVLFRENTEDVYSGKELEEGSDEVLKLNSFLEDEFGWKIRKDSGIGIKPISNTGSERLIRAAINFAAENGKKNLAIVHKGNIMKFTEGAFRKWGYELIEREFSDVAVSWEDSNGNPGDKILVQDVIADAFLQQILIKPQEFDVIATTNLNGDYASDALAAQIGGIGISPGGNINYENGKAVFEATHGTAPKYAGMNKANPGSLILSGEMMFRYMGWNEAADLIITSMEKSILEGNVTYDLARGREDATILSTSEFADSLVRNIQ